MNEESQIDEMRAAVRGDRERAQLARQRSRENALRPIDRPALEETAAPSPESRRGLLSRLFSR